VAQHPAKIAPRWVHLSQFQQGPTERHHVNLGWEKDESKLHHATPSPLSRFFRIFHLFCDTVAGMKQHCSGILLDDERWRSGDAHDSVRHNEGGRGFVKKGGLTETSHGSQLEWSQYFVRNLIEPFGWFGITMPHPLLLLLDPRTSGQRIGTRQLAQLWSFLCDSQGADWQIQRKRPLT
jgi:hypothetical protein